MVTTLTGPFKKDIYVSSPGVEKAFGSRVKLNYDLGKESITHFVGMLATQMLETLQAEGWLKEQDYRVVTNLVEHRRDCEGQEPHHCIDYRLEVR